MALGFNVAAHAEPTGQYTYVCIASDGSSNTLRDGERLSNCKGSYLKKYINGNLVSSLRLNADATEGRSLTRAEIECVIAFVPVGGGIIRVIKVGGKLASYVGLARNVAGISKCMA